MKLTFLGTRGYTEVSNRRHRLHSALEVAYESTRIMIDCGEDWQGRLATLDPDAVVVTHAHPDHAWGLKDGAPCPVHATRDTWAALDFELEGTRTVRSRAPFSVGDVTFEAFPVEHSTRAPTVGYRVEAGVVTIFYVPDVVYVDDRDEALGGVDLYVGDGSTLTQSMVRKIDDRLVGHTPMRTQLTWCQKVGVPRAVFTHCGSEIIEGDERTLGAELRSMADERGVEVEIAHDGQQMVPR